MYDSIGGNYIKNADGALLLFDIANQVVITNPSFDVIRVIF